MSVYRVTGHDVEEGVRGQVANSLHPRSHQQLDQADRSSVFLSANEIMSRLILIEVMYRKAHLLAQSGKERDRARNYSCHTEGVQLVSPHLQQLCSDKT